MSAPLLSEAAARARTDEIRAAITTLMNDQKVTMEMLEAAARDGVHHALGYEHFSAYVDQEIRLALAPANAHARREIVLRLRRLGLSTRTIAEVVGVSQSTVSRDVRSGESSDSPVRGRDGKLYPQVRPHRPPAPGADAPGVPGARTRGFENAYFTAVATVERAVKELSDLHEDDRFRGHLARVQPHERRIRASAETLGRLSAELRPSRRRNPIDIAA